MADQPRTLGEAIDRETALQFRQSSGSPEAVLIHVVTALKVAYGGLPILYGPERECPECGGDRFMLEEQPDGVKLSIVCPKCKGEGTIPGQPVGIVSQEALEAAVGAVLDNYPDGTLGRKAAERDVLTAAAALGIEVADERVEGVLSVPHADGAYVTPDDEGAYWWLRDAGEDGDRVAVWVKRERKEGE